ncbi:hypothetical protein U1Q18_029060 [Sarracenia purpurea var. burkii]
MARRQGLVLACVVLFFAVVGLASAATTTTIAPAVTPTHSPSSTEKAPAASPSGNDAGSANTIGNTDGNSDAAPIGGPVPAGVFTTDSAPAPSPTNGAATLEISAVAGVAAGIAAVFF